MCRHDFNDETYEYNMIHMKKRSHLGWHKGVAKFHMLGEQFLIKVLNWLIKVTTYIVYNLLTLISGHFVLLVYRTL